MSGNLGGDALGCVGVGDWPYTLGAGLYSGCVAGFLALHPRSCGMPVDEVGEVECHLGR